MQISNKLSYSKHKAILSFICLLGAWLIFFWPTIFAIFRPTDTPWLNTFIYGIPVLTLYLFWEKRKALDKIFFASSQLGLVTLFLMVTVFILGEVFGVKYAEHSAVILMVPALMMTAFGPAFVQTFLFPLLYLTIIIPLQDDTFPYHGLMAGTAVFLLVMYLLYRKRQHLETSTLVEIPAWVSINARWFMPTTIAFCILMITPWLGENIRVFYPLTHRVIALRAPLGTDGWVGPRPIPIIGSPIAPLYPNASAIMQAEYFRENSSRESVDLYTAYYHSDRGFNDLLEHNNLLYNPSIWKQTAASTKEIPIGENQFATVLEITLSSGAESRLLWYWFYVAGLSTTDLSLAMLLDKVRIISKYAQGSGVISVSTSFTNTPEDARKRLGSFLDVMYNSLDVLKRPELSYVPRRIQEGI